MDDVLPAAQSLASDKRLLILRADVIADNEPHFHQGFAQGHTRLALDELIRGSTAADRSMVPFRSRR